jgi:hypothetical protein
VKPRTIESRNPSLPPVDRPSGGAGGVASPIAKRQRAGDRVPVGRDDLPVDDVPAVHERRQRGRDGRSVGHGVAQLDLHAIGVEQFDRTVEGLDGFGEAQHDRGGRRAELRAVRRLGVHERRVRLDGTGCGRGHGDDEEQRAEPADRSGGRHPSRMGVRTRGRQLDRTKRAVIAPPTEPRHRSSIPQLAALR